MSASRTPRAPAGGSSAMRPRTIAKHELVGMGSTSSQMAKRDWKPLRSPRNQKMQVRNVLLLHSHDSANELDSQWSRKNLFVFFCHSSFGYLR